MIIAEDIVELKCICFLYSSFALSIVLINCAEVDSLGSKESAPGMR